jgi:hypothetical protein
MELANTPAYYARAKITAVKSFMTQVPALRKIAKSLVGKKIILQFFFHQHVKF